MFQCRVGGPPYAQLAHDAPAFAVSEVLDKMLLLQVDECVVDSAIGNGEVGCEVGY